MTNRYQKKVEYVTALKFGVDDVVGFLQERIGPPSKYRLSLSFTTGWWDLVSVENRECVIVGGENGTFVIEEGDYLVAPEDGSALRVLNKEAFSERYEESTS